ncbi:MAG TPA: hypothetical protein VMU17_03070 [Elusimicrobiota bacterium]|nr:hypothetical protein [Elusimicrobiota bacterium]
MRVIVRFQILFGDDQDGALQSSRPEIFSIRSCCKKYYHIPAEWRANAVDFKPELWRFANGESTAEHFEQWLYAHPELEAQLGKDVYVALISFHFDSADRAEVDALRSRLRSHLEAHGERSCGCAKWKDRDMIRLAETQSSKAFAQQFTLLVEHDENPLIQFVQCRSCNQRWLMRAGESGLQWSVARLSRSQDLAIIQDHSWPDRLIDEMAHFSDYEAWRNRLKPPI